MLNKIVATNNDTTLLILRVSLGTVMLGHGLQKTFGWFEGFGLNNTMNYFTSKVGLPTFMGAFIILVESVGALLLIAGVVARITAFFMIIIIIGAFFVDHFANGFFMNWFGTHKGEGYEFDILFWAIALAILLKGAGKWSFDYLIQQGLKRKHTSSDAF